MDWGSGGPTYAHECEPSPRPWSVKLGLQDGATALGDVDAYITRRLLAVGRPEDALAFLIPATGLESFARVQARRTRS